MSDMRIGRFASLLLLVTLAARRQGPACSFARCPAGEPRPRPAGKGSACCHVQIQVNLVDLFFTVKDKTGELVPHLNKDDCTVEEDKSPQKAQNFVAETNQPLTLGILLDTSGSQQYVLPLEQQAGGQFSRGCCARKTRPF